MHFLERDTVGDFDVTALLCFRNATLQKRERRLAVIRPGSLS